MYKTAETVVDVNLPQSAGKIVKKAREKFDEGKTKVLQFRKSQLKNLLRFLNDNQTKIEEALYHDFRKPKQETIVNETTLMKREIVHFLNHIDDWVKPKKPQKALVNFFDQVLIYNDPYGVVLVIGPWNYPLQLTISPLIGAIAAGNCAIIKPSELCPALSQLLHDELPKYLDPDCYPVYLGGIPETTDLLKERFDYIFFTGSTPVGRIVYAAANKHLTPVTLELGGKSPAYIDASADLELTVRRILWGKCINGGQTCVAPDYVLCTREIQEKFIICARKTLTEFYGDNIRDSPDFCKIISERHCERLVGMLPGLNIAIGGKFEPKDQFIEPTIATDVNPNHAIMEDEIFGPILPIVTINNLDEAISFINKRDKPLALYIFSRRKDVRDKLLNSTSSGGVCVNDTVMQLTADGLPFGGVGPSGMGAYHGKATFDTFTHKKSVLMKNFWSLNEKLQSSRYPPYSPSKTAFIEFALTERRRLPLKYLPHFVMFLLGVAVTVVVYFLSKV